MKKTILRCLLLGFVIALTCQWAMAVDNVVFAGSYKDPDTSIISKYYQKSPTDAFTRAEGEELANSIFAYTGSTFTLDEEESNDEILLYRNTDEKTGICYIELATGKVFFNKGMEDYLIAGETPGLPDDAAAPQIAKNHLQALNLYPSTGVVLHHVGGLGMAIHEEDGTNSNYKKLVFVYENRELDDLTVVGSSRVVTGLGTDNELVSLGRCWVDVSPVNAAPTEILPGTATRERITTQLLEAYPNAEYIEVQNQQLVYYDDGKGIIEPALLISGIVIPQGETDSQSIDWIVSIMVTPHAIYPYDNITPPQPADPPDNPDDIPTGEDE
ncbi:MAG: hypothetical protein JSV88_10370 [Candidatus Aminicenantes bacterium]|nr:MAG: hypothetical protein JSV88_10370 [Candidatus Aminicenantes bacterium]